MGKVGYCSECAGTVRLSADGSCAWGHPATSVSQVRDAPDLGESAGPRVAESGDAARAETAASPQPIAAEPVTISGVEIRPVPTRSAFQEMVGASSVLVKVLVSGLSIVLALGSMMYGLSARQRALARVSSTFREIQAVRARADAAPAAAPAGGHSGYAERLGCFSNQRAVESGAMAYAADTEVPLPTTWGGLTAALVSRGYVPKAPQCLSGGTYEWTSAGAQGRVTCSIHKHWSSE
jgi:hypothetical protein